MSYDKLQRAIDLVANNGGGNVFLHNYVVESSTLTIPAGKTITIPANVTIVAN